MTPRQRVISTLRHEKPDRIPRYDILLPGYQTQWRQVRQRDAQADIFDDYQTIDIGMVLANQTGPFSSGVWRRDVNAERYQERDSWGRRIEYSRSGTFFEVLQTALQDKRDLDTLIFEDPWTGEAVAAYTQLEADIHDRFAPVSGVMGLFMPSYYLRGELELLIDLKEDEAFCRTLAERVADFICAQGETALRVTDTWDTALWVYDELGNNKSAVMSPETFERVYLQPYRRIIAHWKALGAANIILHCDGNCLALLDLLLEAGFTGIQGVNPTAGMTVPSVKAAYGSRISLIGGMCNIRVLREGSEEDIAREVAEIIEVACDGGVIIGTHSIDIDIPVEKYDYYHQVLAEYDERW